MYSCRFSQFATLFLILTFVTCSLSASAQDVRGKQDDWYPLGGLGAQALPGREPGSIEVRLVHPNGAAGIGKLQAGDLIIKVNGKKLKKSGEALIDAFCLRVQRAENKKARSKKTGILKLTVRRGDQEIGLAIPLAVLGKFKGKSPAKCPRSQAVLKNALKFLAKTQDDEGKFGDVFSNQNQGTAGAALAGLAFLGGGKEYQQNYFKALEYVKQHVLDDDDRMSSKGGANWNQSNWSLGYGAILLAEALAQEKERGDPSTAEESQSQEPDANPIQEASSEIKNLTTRELLKKVIAKIQLNQEQSGGWAHGPGGPNALKYLELEIMSNFCMAGMGLAERAGIELDSAKKTKAIEFVKSCTSGGGVAYSTRKGQKGHGEAGRTAGAYWAFRQLGRNGRPTKSMWKFLNQGLDTLPQGHVSPAMHILSGALACAVKGKKTYEKFWSLYRDYFMSVRDGDGAITCRPTDESRQLKSNSDRGNGDAFTTAHFVIAMQLSQGRYKLLDTGSARR